MRWCSVPCAKRACSLQLAESSGDFPSDTSPGRIGKRQGKPAQLVAPNGSRITVTLGDNTGHLLTMGRSWSLRHCWELTMWVLLCCGVPKKALSLRHILARVEHRTLVSLPAVTSPEFILMALVRIWSVECGTWNFRSWAFILSDEAATSGGPFVTAAGQCLAPEPVQPASLFIEIEQQQRSSPPPFFLSLTRGHWCRFVSQAHFNKICMCRVLGQVCGLVLLPSQTCCWINRWMYCLVCFYPARTCGAYCWLPVDNCFFLKLYKYTCAGQNNVVQITICNAFPKRFTAYIST